jgi:SAM-dependent methyltransferase
VPNIETDDWNDAVQNRSNRSEATGTALLRVETETGIFIRDEARRLIQTYQIPPQLAEWLHYGITRLAYPLEPSLGLGFFKTKLLYLLQQTIRKLSVNRRRLSIVEAGCTVGENYFAMREFIRRDGLDLALRYRGFDINENVAAAGTILFGDDPDFRVTAAECDILGRLPDRSADLVLALGVLNHANDATAALADAMRVARVAVIAMIQVNDRDTPLRMQAAGGTGAQWVYTIFPRSLVRDLARRHGITHGYLVTRSNFADSTASGQGRYYLGIDDVDLDVDIEWMVLAKAPIFPEWSAIEWLG